MHDDLKEFYDPHPGIAGALAPIPGRVRRVANELNGQTLSLKQAVEMIQQAAPNGKVDVTEKYEFIGLEITYGRNTHVWRVIRYRTPSKK